MGLAPEKRQHIRQVNARPVTADLAAIFDVSLSMLSGKSELAGAIRYTRSRWAALSRYLDDGHLEISNNAAERAIRPLTLARKNYLFAGSDADGERAAAAYTLIETAKLNGPRPRSLSAATCSAGSPTTRSTGSLTCYLGLSPTASRIASRPDHTSPSQVEKAAVLSQRLPISFITANRCVE